MPTRALALTIACATGLVALAAPAEAASAYKKKAVAVYEEPGGAYMGVVKPGLADLGRFEFVSVAGGSSLADFMAKVRAAGPGDGPIYVFVPEYSFGDISWDPPQQETTRYASGQVKTTLVTDVKCPFTYRVEIYDARTGTLYKTLEHTTTLKRRFQAEWDQRNTDREVGYKEGALIARARAEAMKRPEEAFADLARSGLGGFRSWVASEVRMLPEFQLKATVTGWDSARDLVFTDMGRDFKIRLNDGFKLVRDGRELGYMRVVKSAESTSDVRPVFLDTRLQPGDVLLEYPKSNIKIGAKGGVAWLGAPAAVGGIGFEADFAPVWGGTDTFAAFDLGAVSRGEVGGVWLEAGLVKKFFFRRWGLALGAKPGWVGLGRSNSFGATGTVGLHSYLTPDFTAFAELGMAAYTPVVQQGGRADGQYVNPFGPVGRLGLSIVF